MKLKVIEEFEAGLAGYVGVKHAVGASLGRTALLVLLKSIGIEKESEVIMPAYICEVVPNAVLKSGGVPVFVDIRTDDYHISIPHLKSLLSEKTRAVIINHTFGYPEDVDGITEALGGRDICLIEDVAQSLGAKYKSRRVGSLGDAAFFSLSKNIFNIGGGAIATNDDAIATNAGKLLADAKTNSLFTHVFISLMSFMETRRVHSSFGNWYFNMIGRFAGKSGALTKGYYDSLQIPEGLTISSREASLAISRLRKLDNSNEKRRRNRKILDDMLKEKGNFDILSPSSRDTEPVCSWYAICLKEPGRRGEVIKMLAHKGVFLYSFWDPIPIKARKYNEQSLADVPDAVRTAGATLVFKMAPGMSDKQLEKVGRVLQSV